MHESATLQMFNAQKAQPAPVALFVSDIHLHESLPKTTAAFLHFLTTTALQAEQLYVLGDLFEYWAGDDDIDTPYNRKVVGALHAASKAGVALFWMAGNRDFLVGEAFGRATGMTLLTEPHVVHIAGQELVLMHGDAQCTDDISYMAFRAQVRSPAWQREFLAMPLPQRKAIIEGMRGQSRQAQQSKSYDIMDVNQAAIAAVFDASHTSIMIHGHTHRPARHEYRQGENIRVRQVLPDWDCDTANKRGGWLALTSDGLIRRYGLDGSEHM